MTARKKTTKPNPKPDAPEFLNGRPIEGALMVSMDDVLTSLFRCGYLPEVASYGPRDFGFRAGEPRENSMMIFWTGEYDSE